MLDGSVIGKARRDGLWTLDAVDIRDYAVDRHRSVDGTPAGGGPGMVLRADVVASAIDAVCADDDERPLIGLTPGGAPLTQRRVRELADGSGAIFLCGRFEGFDARLFERRPIEQVSIGDFVLAGGEVAAMAVIEAVVRLLPGVLGDEASVEDESFENGLLEYPQFTRPQSWEGAEIPEILLSGDHGRIAHWRQEQAELATQKKRPDLWARYDGASKKRK